jgi:hypothetical protein
MQKFLETVSLLALFALILAACSDVGSSVAITTVTTTEASTSSTTASGTTLAFPNGSVLYSDNILALSYPQGWQKTISSRSTTTDSQTSATYSYIFMNQAQDSAAFGVTISAQDKPIDPQAAASNALGGIDGTFMPDRSVASTVQLGNVTWQQYAWKISISNAEFEVQALSNTSLQKGKQLVIAFGAYNGPSATNFATDYKQYFWPMAQSCRFIRS